MGTFLVGMVLLGIVGLIVRSLRKNRQNGKSLQCGDDCSRCGGHCSH